jgi:ferrous iron transport protein A
MSVKQLNKLIPAQCGKIAKLHGGGALRQRLIDMGLVSGAEIKVIRIAPLGDPVEYQVRGYNLSLRKHEAENILVEVDTIPLSDIAQSGAMRLVEVNGGRHLKQRIEQMGLMIGATLSVRQKIRNRAVIVQMNDRQVVIDHRIAQKILVHPMDADA